MRGRFVILLLILLVGIIGVAYADAPKIYVLDVHGVIVPAVASYVERAIDSAEGRAELIIIRLDTPGGLLESTKKIVESIMNSDVPVCVYVSPKGARAASAGVFITLSAHIAAMAPGTHIGAAHPVAVGGEMPEEYEEKIVKDAVAWIRSICEERGRNADWAEKAVRRSESITDREAVEKNVIDIRADNLEELISKLHGFKTNVKGKEVVIETKGARVINFGMNFAERFLQVISEPNIAYILMSIGTLGIITEIFHPGLIIPGVVGGISLLLSFYSLHVLDANWAGLFLILLGFGLLVAELFTPGIGFLMGGGLVSFIMGSLLLFTGKTPYYEGGISPWVIGIISFSIAVFIFFAARAVLRTHRRPQPTGREGMIGKVGYAKTPLKPRGQVFVHGELWDAIIEGGEAEAGEEIVVTGIEGLRLRVKKKGEV